MRIKRAILLHFCTKLAILLKMKGKSMARLDRLEIYRVLMESGLVPLFYTADIAVAHNVADAVAKGGARFLEFTNRGERALDAFKALHAYCSANHPQLMLGVGSVIDAPTAALYSAHGAAFIVAPIFDEATARLCNRRKLPYMPGVGSVTEITRAEEWGVEIVKVFPGGQVGGPEFVKSVMGPMPWTRMMPSGGVEATRDSINGWIKAGACAVGMGSNLITKEVLASRDYEALTENVRRCLEWIREARS
jgi:2-dehydro-3-deoxyphosphogluconate aldolase / (4S)-4-hydroxy-2-oxoglutarate aldolase